jgi:hypothetical protein
MSPRYQCRKDANHDELSDAARRLGWYVVDTYQFAQYHAGWPDAVWAKPGRVVLVEYKVGNETLNDKEERFRQLWPAEYEIVRDLDDVVRVTNGASE